MDQHPPTSARLLGPGSGLVLGFHIASVVCYFSPCITLERGAESVSSLLGNLAEGEQEGGLRKVDSEASGGGEAVLKALWLQTWPSRMKITFLIKTFD